MAILPFIFERAGQMNLNRQHRIPNNQQENHKEQQSDKISFLEITEARHYDHKGPIVAIQYFFPLYLIKFSAT
jgi:hypothetical protein